VPAALATGELLAACGPGLKGAGGSSNTKDLVIGYGSPQTGSLAGFAVPDDFVLKQINATSSFAKGLTKGGKTYHFNIIEVDNQSAPPRGHPGS
jgi:branched-chain amino acid transport system substrate-binding protein